MEVIDYNGEGIWSRDAVLSRYSQYATKLGITPRNLSPRQSEAGNPVERIWIYPVMDEVIKGIEAGDAACIRIGVEFIEENAKFPFGKILKSNTARALRRATLSEAQKQRIRRRVFGLLRVGHIPHEYREYAKLVRKIGFDADDIPEVNGTNPYVARFRAYYEQLVPAKNE